MLTLTRCACGVHAGCYAALNIFRTALRIILPLLDQVCQQRARFPPQAQLTVASLGCFCLLRCCACVCGTQEFPGVIVPALTQIPRWFFWV